MVMVVVREMERGEGEEQEEGRMGRKAGGGTSGVVLVVLWLTAERK